MQTILPSDYGTRLRLGCCPGFPFSYASLPAVQLVLTKGIWCQRLSPLKDAHGLSDIGLVERLQSCDSPKLDLIELWVIRYVLINRDLALFVHSCL